MPFRFVHAADIHLDSPLRTLAMRNPALGELIGIATRRAFEAIIDLCLEEAVDALILAGDLYDGEQTSMKTARFLADQLKRLQDAGVRAFIIRGNHDAIARITRELVLPESVKLFQSRADVVTIEARDGGPEIAIHGVSFADRHAPQSLLPKYRPPVEGAVNIGLMHTSLGGSKAHDLYAPCTAAELAAHGYRYWALGHIHARSAIEGDCTIVMPGMPQGRDIGEAGARSVSLVTVADDHSITVEECRTSVAQFERVEVDVSDVEDWRPFVDRIADALGRTRDDVASEHLVARLVLRGTTPLAWRIRRDIDLVRTQAEERADAIGRTWIDAIDVNVIKPSVNIEHSGALAELRHLIADDVMTSQSYKQAMTGIMEELASQLPQECRPILGNDEASMQKMLSMLALDGSEHVLARLEERSTEAA